MQNMTVGPAQGALTLHTGVEGKAAKTGHALTIEISDWQAVTSFDGQTPVAVELTAQLLGLQVVRGDGGLKSLSDKDKRTIRDSAFKTLKAKEHPEVRFVSTSVRAAPDGWALLGDLTIAGATRQVTVDVAVTAAGDGWQVLGTASVVQTEHGIAPYSALMGALRVSDRVGVQVAVTVPGPA